MLTAVSRLSVVLLSLLFLVNTAYAERTKINGFYSKDSAAVYYFDMPIADSNPETFKVLRYPFYAQDKKQVYYHSFVIPSARPGYFRLMNESYARDGNRMYFRGRPMELVFRKTFRILSEPLYLATDHRFVFFEHTPLEGSDPGSFKILNNSFWKDQNQVFFYIPNHLPTVIPGADAASFTIDSDTTAHDINRQYSLDILAKIARKPKQ